MGGGAFGSLFPLPGLVAVLHAYSLDEGFEGPAGEFYALFGQEGIPLGLEGGEDLADLGPAREALCQEVAKAGVVAEPVPDLEEAPGEGLSERGEGLDVVVQAAAATEVVEPAL